MVSDGLKANIVRQIIQTKYANKLKQEKPKYQQKGRRVLIHLLEREKQGIDKIMDQQHIKNWKKAKTNSWLAQMSLLLKMSCRSK